MENGIEKLFVDWKVMDLIWMELWWNYLLSLFIGWEWDTYIQLLDEMIHYVKGNLLLCKK